MLNSFKKYDPHFLEDKLMRQKHTSSFKCHHLARNSRSHQYALLDLLQQYQQSLISQSGVICAGRASCHNLTGLDYFAGDIPRQGAAGN